MFTKTTALPTIVTALAAVSVLIITFTATNGLVIYHVSAQVNNSSSNKTSMDLAMAALTKIHLMAADQVLMNGNTTAAFDQVNLAYLQLSMLGMKEMDTLNETEAMKFMQGGGVTSDIKMVPENCIIIQGGILECLDPLTRSYSLAK